MKRSVQYITGVFFLILFVACNSGSSNLKSDPKDATGKPEKELYTCPMDTDVHSDKSGVCPKCNMDLEKVTK